MTTTGNSPSTGVQNWHELYRAALFEINQQKLPSRIAEAEKVILRARELFVSSGNGEEAQAIDDALYALRALRHCVEMKTSDRRLLSRTRLGSEGRVTPRR